MIASDKWVKNQNWDKADMMRALAILDRRRRMENEITVEELRRVMGK